MFRRIIKKTIRFTLILSVVGVILLLTPQSLAQAYAQPRMKTVDSAPSLPVAIVFGAGLTRSGNASAVLRDRIRAAADLYFAGKVEKLLMSGDNSDIYYNEPSAMREYALSLGVPEADIVLDFAGRRTYDTCYRARAIFGVTDAILVTQAYHLPRALLTCNLLGVTATGVPAYESRYWRGALEFWTIREYPATAAAFWDLFFARPEPILGEPEPIFYQELQYRKQGE
ncbi:MAG: YdcF family protein [Anaerolineales bacterium]|nr:YdcF family protein [Anaerolineales bacterium]